MAKKLTGQQVGRLAEHVEKCIRDNPLPPKVTDRQLEDDQEKWEAELNAAVNKDPLLPRVYVLNRYHGDLIEFLVDYYSRGRVK